MTEERAITTVEAPKAVALAGPTGTLALAMMSDVEFEARLDALKRGQQRVARVQRELMTKDVDYGNIPGTDKPTLYKAGAEKLCNLYGLIPEFQEERITGDGANAPTLQVYTTCYLHAGAEGPVVGLGVGEANSWEKKHRYRTAEKACPKCGALKTITKSKAERGGGWFCWAKKGGCAATFSDNDPAIAAQQLGQVDNPDPYDLSNTLVKMAAKRAYVDATLRTTATSGLFTQDLEDLEPAPPTTTTKAATATAEPAANLAEEPSGNGKKADPATEFFKRAKELGYTPKLALSALGVKDFGEWLADDKTVDQAIDMLKTLR